MNVARYPVHKMIQDLMRDPPAAAAFKADPEAAFARYGLTEEEKRLLRDGSTPALQELGVHPNMQMKYHRLRAPAPPPAAAPPPPGGPLAAYLDRLMER